MSESVCLNISANSDDPILEFDDIEKSNICKWKHLAFIFLLIFPIMIFAIDLMIYPYPPQMDVYEFCDDILGLFSRTEFKNMKVEFEKTDMKLLSIKEEMSLSESKVYETFLGYKIAKEMLEDHKSELESVISRQRILWHQCITQNLVTSLIPIKAKLQLFIENIICLTILSFFISFLVYGSTRSFFETESRTLLNICFIIQSFFIVFTGIVFVLASIYYCEIWKLKIVYFFCYFI